MSVFDGESHFLTKYDAFISIIAFATMYLVNLSLNQEKNTTLHKDIRSVLSPFVI